MMHLSPNFNDRPKGTKIKYLILHYTGMVTGEVALQRLCDPAAEVSAHYLIEEDGRIFALVPEGKRAWHAGVASWEDDTDINGLSIGIELVNPGHDAPGSPENDSTGDYRPFPEAQMGALISLCQEILARHDIEPCHVLGHSDVAPGRKIDPGELFDWKRLASEGIGLWPLAENNSGERGNVASCQRKLARYGYKIDETGIVDQATHRVLSAFQRHFRPTEFSGAVDGQCPALLDVLLRLKYQP